MTVAALASSKSYLENGVSLTFALPFQFGANTISATRVLASGVVQELVAGVDFSTTGGTTDAGGSATLTTSVAGATIRFERTTPRSQSTDYTPNDRFPAESHEVALDRAMRIDQEQDDALVALATRALTVPDGQTAPAVPSLVGQTGMVLAVVGGQLVLLPNSAAAITAQLATRGVFQSLQGDYAYDLFDGADRPLRGSTTPTGHVWDYAGPPGATPPRIFKNALRAGADTGTFGVWENNTYPYIQTAFQIREIAGALTYTETGGGKDRSKNIITFIASADPSVVKRSVHTEVSPEVVRLGAFVGGEATASFAGTTMTVADDTVGGLQVGTFISGAGITPFSKITAVLGGGQYTLDNAHALGSRPIGAFTEVLRVPHNLGDGEVVGVRMTLNQADNTVTLYLPGGTYTVPFPGLANMDLKYAMYQIRPEDGALVGAWEGIYVGAGLGAPMMAMAGAASQNGVSRLLGKGITQRGPAPVKRTLSGAAGTEFPILFEGNVDNAFAGFAINVPELNLTADSVGIRQFVRTGVYCGTDGNPSVSELWQTARPIQALSGLRLRWVNGTGGVFKARLSVIKAIAADVDLLVDFEGSGTLIPPGYVDATVYDAVADLPFDVVGYEQDVTATLTGAGGTWLTVATQAAFSGFGDTAEVDFVLGTAAAKSRLVIQFSSVPFSAEQPANWINQILYTADNGPLITDVRVTYEVGPDTTFGATVLIKLQVRKFDASVVSCRMRSRGFVTLLSTPTAGTTLADNTITLTLQPGRLVGSHVDNAARGDTTTVYPTPLTGGTVSILADCNYCDITPAGTLATLTVNLPAAPIEGQVVTVSTSQTLTALTVAPTFTGAPTTLAAGGFFAVKWRASNSTWRRVG